MSLTLRGASLLGLTAVVLALATWLPVVAWVALAYAVGALILLVLDGRAAGGAGRVSSKLAPLHRTRDVLGLANR